MKQKILVTGGAGFIGSHTLIELTNAGHEIVVVDNFINSNKKSIKEVEKIIGKSITLYDIDIRDKDKLLEVFIKEQPTGVIHFAALKAVGESVQIPLTYYENNITGTLILLRVMEEDCIRRSTYCSYLRRFSAFSDQSIWKNKIDD